MWILVIFLVTNLSFSTSVGSFCFQPILHFLGLACFFHLLENSLMLFPIREVIDIFGKWFSHLWGLLYFGKSVCFSFMSCLHTTQFSYEGCTIYVHCYSSLFNGRIHTNIHLFIHVIQSLFFPLFFLCMLVRILSSKIYFLCLFLASLLIELIYYFYMVLELHGAQPFHLLHGIRVPRLIKFYRV